ncbi:ScbA/BarX family gamma-butyrolactone biosynthesis protein [Promicromonospora sp. NPDC060271]|uniref:ScbA/BarX family gamma-butyrolactone biosynthesis protein n=1 Tax=Promicromonospora sp. NPDC060271 TaxID=3347089 RepID=UPI00365FFB12
MSLSYAATVAREYVHRRAVAEVFVTDTSAAGEPGTDGTYRVAAQLPRGHLMQEGPVLDYSLLVETVRQAAVSVSHRHLGIPLGLAFLFRDLDVEVDDPDALRVGARPAHLEVGTTIEAQRTVGGRVTGVRFSGRVFVDGRLALTGQGSLMVMTPAEWKSLRELGRRHSVSAAGPLSQSAPSPSAQPPSTQPPSPARPRTVGRRDPRNVVVSRPVLVGRRRAESLLHVDTGHPYLFDHPLDHAPGNLLLEAARQSAAAAVSLAHGGPQPAGLVVLACTGSFDAFVELDLPTQVVTEVAELTKRGALTACSTRTSILHAGRVAAQIDLTMGVTA